MLAMSMGETYHDKSTLHVLLERIVFKHLFRMYQLEIVKGHFERKRIMRQLHVKAF